MDQPFAIAFAEGWSRPTVEGLVKLLHPDVVLLQPHLPPIRGREAARGEFRRLFAWLPGLHGAVERSAEADGFVFIEWQLKLPVGRCVVSIPAVDLFRLQDGLGIERVVYFDQVALIRTVLTHPSLWLGCLRYRFGRR